MAKIKELEARKGFDFIEASVISISETRDVRNGELKVADAQIKDSSGTVKLTLWNDEIGTIKEGDKIKITKGWTNEFQGNLSISAGKFGTLEVVEASTGKSSKAKKEEPLSDEVKFAIDEDII